MTNYHRRTVFAVACLGMLLFGIVLTTLGAILPDIITRFNVTKASAGSLFLLMSFCILLGSLLFGPSVDRLGYRVPLTAASALVAVGIEIIAFAPSLALVRLGVALIGAGGGVLNVATNAVVADTAEGGKAAGLSLLGVFFGIGAVGVPFTIGTLEAIASQQNVLAGVGAIAVLIVLITAFTRFPGPKHSQSFPLRQALRLVREETLLLFGLMLFLESGMEITVGGWTSTFAREALLLSGRAALFFLSLYWLGTMLARLILGSLLKTYSPRNVLVLSLFTAGVGAIVLITSHATSLAAIGIFLVGAGFAAVFPVVLGWLGERYQALSGTAFSLALVMALTGGMILPYATGLLGQRFGMRASLIIVPVALLLSGTLLAVATARRLTSNPSTSEIVS
jgi:FHS family glucose/mannose:H+ symporter-like MFS transporter